MKRLIPNIVFAILFAATIAAGAYTGGQVRHLRESEAFYRWIFAAATNVRLGWEDSGEYEDDRLFARCSAACIAARPDRFGVLQPGGDTYALSQAVSYTTNDDPLWELAAGPALARERADFLEYARERKLLYAQDIQYAEAQASGVNLFNLFFGFRKVAANFVWLQVDRYWHKGMDFRMAPLLKTCVTLDPNFIDAYLIGAWHLAYNVTAKMMDTPQELRTWSEKYQACIGEKERYYYWAIDHLKDGIRKNPRNYKIYFDLGFAIYKNKLHDYANAVKYIEEAVRVPHDRWVPPPALHLPRTQRRLRKSARRMAALCRAFPRKPDRARGRAPLYQAQHRPDLREARTRSRCRRRDRRNAARGPKTPRRGPRE